MKWRKWNNILHRDLGYLFFGLTIIYVISGISLNHKHNWNPNYIQKKQILSINPVAETFPLSEERIRRITDELGVISTVPEVSGLMFLISTPSFLASWLLRAYLFLREKKDFPEEEYG